ncbi:MAG TPA: TIM barrel protein [Anaerolineales bacterium]|nr:TIM barrel protein [Anaerolineales bacterium]
MTKANEIKRGVSLYSYQEEFFLRKMTLEDCIAVSARLGALGVESIAEQMMPGFPNLSDAFYDSWHGWMALYGTTPTCHDMFLDTKMYKGRLMTDDEMLASVIRDLKHASRLGCTVIRVIVNTPPHIMELAAPYAEQYNVRLGLEIHAPFHFRHEWIQKHYEVMERTGSKFLGFVPDMGVYERRFPRVRSERSIRNGAKAEIVKYICDAYEGGADLEAVAEEVKRMGGGQLELGVVDDVKRVFFDDPRRLLQFMPRVFHIHAKFYEMVDDATEYSIPYNEVIPVLIEGGYSGYLSSEYEGNRHIQDVYEVDSLEQVRRQQAMFKSLLGEA